MDLAKYRLTDDPDGNTYVHFADDPTFSTRRRVDTLADAMRFVIEREEKGTK